MGNQPSKVPARSSVHHEKDDKLLKHEKEKDRERELEREREKKMMSRRISFQALSHGKATAADPSASTESAVAQTILQPLAYKPTLQQHLQPTQPHSPEQNEKSPMSVARSISPAVSHGQPYEVALRPKEDQDLMPVPSAQMDAEPSIPMDVPGSTSSRPERGSTVGSTSSRSTPQASTPHYTPMSGLQRPPRMPLAIADEVRAPESPALEPSTAPSEEIPIFDDDVAESDMPRKSSMLSSVTADEEDVGSELQPYAVDTGSVDVISTRIDWRGNGERIYVTGTFAHWDKKFRLHKSESGEGMTATIGFPPGTHHLKFIVDGEMVPSPDLPTTVDIHNVLVNYIEVVKDDPRRDRRESVQKIKPPPPHLYPPIALPPEEELASGELTPEPQEEPLEPPEEEIPVGDFRQLMPQALIDMELPEEEPKFRQAYNIINDTPGPPSLPLFLSRSILNGILPHKDDNSVLTLPNHTVLNHLATSSIKNGVLATSVTTRYKKKYVTTIMYKPTFEATDAS